MSTQVLQSLGIRGRYFEGPRWHDHHLLMVDSLARAVLRIGDDGAAEKVCDIEGISGGMGVMPDGEIFVTSMFDRKLLRYRNGRPAGAIDLSGVAAGTIDDMIVDGLGSIYVGDLGIDLLDPKRAPDAAKGRGRILKVDERGGARAVAEGLSFPNGIAVSGDRKMLVVAESDGDCLSRFEIKADGSLSSPLRFGRFGEPDGLCIDDDGAIWVSLFKEDAFVRVDQSGRELARVPVKGRRAVACALGGEALSTLYCISAETSHEDLMRGKSMAYLDATEVETPGFGWP
jgi:sugar lactone lactonase YvrE